MLQQIVDWIEPAFLAAGYAIVAAAALLDRSLFIGLVVPGESLLALGGVYASRDLLNLPLVMISGGLASAVGESAGYWLGRRYGRGLIKRVPVARRLEGRFRQAENYFERHGGKTVAVGRYSSVAGVFIPFIAGVSRMPYLRFLAFDLPAIAVWAVAIPAFGYFFGRNIEFVDTVLSRFGWAMAGAFMVGFGGWFLWKRWRSAG